MRCPFVQAPPWVVAPEECTAAVGDRVAFYDFLMHPPPVTLLLGCLYCLVGMLQRPLGAMRGPFILPFFVTIW